MIIFIIGENLSPILHKNPKMNHRQKIKEKNRLQMKKRTCNFWAIFIPTFYPLTISTQWSEQKKLYNFLQNKGKNKENLYANKKKEKIIFRVRKRRKKCMANKNRYLNFFNWVHFENGSRKKSKLTMKSMKVCVNFIPALTTTSLSIDLRVFKTDHLLLLFGNFTFFIFFYYTLN